MDKLKYYCAKKKLVRIKRDPQVDPNNCHGFILDYSDHFILIAHEYDFIIDGWSVLDRSFIEKIDAPLNNNYCKKILLKEGLLEKIIPPFHVDLSNYRTVFGSLKEHKQFVVVEDERPETGIFLIGPIKQINKNSISIRHFDGTGKWVSGKRTVDYKDITVIQFGNNYIRLHERYIDSGI